MNISASSAAASSATAAAATNVVDSNNDGASEVEESGDLIAVSNDKGDKDNDEDNYDVSAINLNVEFFVLPGKSRTPDRRGG